MRVEGPEQYCPPFSGLNNFKMKSFSFSNHLIYLGLSQRRCDFCTALPHVRVQGDQGDHSPQLPLIGCNSCVLRHWPRKQR